MKKLLFTLVMSQSFFIQATLINLQELFPTTTSSNLANTLKNYLQTNNKLIVLKFFAHWCSPCRSMHQIIEKIEEHFQNKITIINIDIEKYRAVSNEYNFSKIPTLIFYKNGKEQQRINSTTKDTIIKIINALL
jgi:thioredoxin 1